MKVVSSYCVKIVGEEKIFRDTIKLYRSAVLFICDVCLSEWNNGISELLSNSKTQRAQRFVETLIHGKSGSQVTYPGFDTRFYKFPSYLRRSAISDALGIVSSYQSNHKNWEDEGKRGKEPRMPKEISDMPAFYRDNMYKEVDGTSALLKLYRNHDWVWVPVRLRKQDTDYISEKWSHIKPSAPSLVKRNRRYALCFAFEESVPVNETPLEKQTILSVDLGINNDAVCSVMRSDGAILARKFIDFTSDKDRMNHLLNKMRRGMRENGPKGGVSYIRKATSINKELSRKISRAIVSFAAENHVDVIVMEHLNFKGKKKGCRSKRQRLHMWRKRDIQERVTHQAHRNGIRVTTVNPKNTSKLAFDGSGEVTRNAKNASLCVFKSGKQYHCDLCASYNIGARYFIRELLKPLTVTERSGIEAKVPDTQHRTSCTLSTLISLHAVLASLREHQN